MLSGGSRCYNIGWLKESSKIKGGVTFPLIFWQLVMDLKFFDTALKGWSADYREVGRNLLLCF